jgi:hypothetical protein
MTDNTNLHPIVYDTDGDPGNTEESKDTIFRPNGTYTVNDTENGSDYHSVTNRNNTKTDQVNQTKEAESLTSIIDRLDYPDNASKSNANNNSQETLSQENDLKSVMTEEFNEVLSTMRVDMVSIIKLLQTLHSNMNELTTETDNVKGDIYNLVQAVSKVKDKMEHVNTNTIKRQQKSSNRTDGQIQKICSRLEALERANFTTHESVNKNEQKTKPRSHQNKDVALNLLKSVPKTQEEIVQNPNINTTKEIFDSQGSLKRQQLRVRPKRVDKSTRDQVGNKNVSTSNYGTVSRMANRSGKYEDTVNKSEIKFSKIANRGTKDKIKQKPRKSRIDVITKQISTKQNEDSDSSDKSIELNDSEEKVENKKNRGF